MAICLAYGQHRGRFGVSMEATDVCVTECWLAVTIYAGNGVQACRDWVGDSRGHSEGLNETSSCGIPGLGEGVAGDV